MAQKPAQPPTPVRDWYAITNEAPADGQPSRAKVNIYDAIGGWWGTNAAEFVAELDGLDVDELEVHINSPGGAVWDGLAIMNSLKRHRARVTVIVDGLAASAASIVAMAGDEVVMAEGAQMMIHQAAGGAWGTAEFLRDTAVVLDKIDGNMAGIYARRAGGTREEWLELMRLETWYDADEAVAAGLADRADASIEADDAEARFDLSMFAYAGRSHAPDPIHRQRLEVARLSATAGPLPHQVGSVTDYQTPVSTEPGFHNRKEGPVVDEFLQNLRQRLGVTNAEATFAEILAALDEVLAEQATTTPTAALPEGVVTIDQTVLDELRADAAAGRQARDDQIGARRDQIVVEALRAGKITPASRKEWREALDRDELGTVALLGTLAAGAFPLEAKAHAGSLEDASDEDAFYNRAWGSAPEGI